MPTRLIPLAVLLSQALYDQLSEHAGKPNLGRRRKSGLTLVEPVHTKSTSGSTPNASWWQSVSSIMSGGGEDGMDSEDAQHGATKSTVKGLYMYGGVGCGKTMLMDLFVASAPLEFKV